MLTDIILPLLLFPALTVLEVTNILPSIQFLGPEIRSSCKPGSPHFIPHTNNDLFDTRLCGLVSVFHVAMKPELTPFLVYFIGTLAPVAVLFQSFESARKRRRFTTSHSALLFGTLGQLVTFAAVMPFYWICEILSGRTKRRTGKVTQAHAEAAVFGLFIGWVIPSVAMVAMADPGITGLWQFAPIIGFIAGSIHLLFRPPTVHSQSGFRTVQAAYIGAFLVASSIHLSTVFKFRSLDDALAFFFPAMYAVAPTEVVLRHTANIFQWDFAVGSGSCLLGSLWFAQSVSQLLGLVAWIVVGSVVFGPGAAFAAIALWRESRLSESYHYEEKPKTL
ncbi:uncharacterized protein EV420DRAFT_1764708 [Desarmillaria tabescens]|uniref:Uncharacterized protein n=1 Tax=Armillaria tabescens TaxID=1929756 RepID=A0AA39KAV0_ARMTA|nr:uncharacterized protein EV420DRAFT_1764708 [Desarmillaria tabescens]KAK0457769.1 hypothetical protein EV420DRAFT_1764708 [Desarmillaria tabescens]